MTTFSVNTTNETIFFTGLGAEIRQATEFGSETQKVSKQSGLPLYQVRGDLQIAEGEVLAGVNLNIASKTEPTIKARTLYTVSGKLFITPYVSRGTNRVAYSIETEGLKEQTNPFPTGGDK